MNKYKKMKLVRENINEEFTEKSDPISDMSIGKIDISSIYDKTVLDGLYRWYKFWSDLNLIGKKVTFETMPMKTDVTIIVVAIKRGELPNIIYFYDEEQRKYVVNILGKLIIHK